MVYAIGFKELRALLGVQEEAGDYRLLRYRTEGREALWRLSPFGRFPPANVRTRNLPGRLRWDDGPRTSGDIEARGGDPPSLSGLPFHES